jgi:hypothetical protein
MVSCVPHALIHVLFLEKECRQKTQDRVLCAVEEDALSEPLLDVATRRNAQLKTFDDFVG